MKKSSKTSLQLTIIFFIASIIIITLAMVVSAPSLDPEDNRIIGLEYLNESGNITDEENAVYIHMWDVDSDYYLNESSGMQITNHFQDYWTKNVFCLWIETPGGWQRRCADSMDWSWVNWTDGSTYVALNGTTTYSEGPYSATIRITYWLGNELGRINMSIGLKNTGQDITDMYFGWIVKDIQVNNTQENNFLELRTIYQDPEIHNLSNENLSLQYNQTEMLERKYMIFENSSKQSVIIWWDEHGWKDGIEYDTSYIINSTYRLLPNQDNAPVALLIHVGKLDNDVIAYTNFWWRDAVKTLDTVTLNYPDSDPNIMETQTFDMNCTWTETGNGAGETGDIYWIYTPDGGSTNITIPSSGSELTTQDANPTVGTTDGGAMYGITVTGAGVGSYNVSCTVYGENLGANVSSPTQQEVTVTGDTEKPSWSNNITNDTDIKYNDTVGFNTTWSDNMGLSGWIFNSNITGAEANSTFNTTWGANNESTYYINVSVSKGKDFFYRFYANDTANNWNETNKFNFTINNSAPTTPTLIYPSNNSNFTTLPVELNYSSSDVDTADTITYWIYINGTLNGSTPINWSFNATNSTYTWIIIAGDGDDNSSNSSTYQFTIDSAGPVISDLTNTSTDNQSTNLEWSCDENCNYTVRIYNSSTKTSADLINTTNNDTFALSHNPYFKNLTNLTTYWVNLTAYDERGNSKTNNTFNFTTAQTVVTDTTYPNVTLNFPANDSTETSTSVSFICTSYDNVDLENVTLYFSSGAGGPTTVSFQDGVDSYNGTRDTYIDSIATTTNYGDGTNTDPLYSWNIDGDGPETSILIKWNISSISAGSTVTSVNITVTDAGDQSAAYEIYEVLRNWTEMGATWETYDGTNNWGTAGAQNTASDRNTTVFGTLQDDVAGSGNTFVIELNSDGIDLVQDWVDGTKSNYGFIVQNYTPLDGGDFYSREQGTVAYRPKLTIAYTGGTSWHANETKDITGTENETTFEKNMTDNESYYWNCYVCDAADNCNFTASNYTFKVNTSYSAGDTCSCPSSGDWSVQCSDNCIITSECDLKQNGLYLDGTGTFTIEADIINIKNITGAYTCGFIKGAGNITIVKN